MPTNTQDSNREIYGFTVGDEVTHKRDDSLTGFVMELDSKHDLGDVTTCRVVWGALSFEEAKDVPYAHQDIQWTNKLDIVDQQGRKS